MRIWSVVEHSCLILCTFICRKRIVAWKECSPPTKRSPWGVSPFTRRTNPAKRVIPLYSSPGVGPGSLKNFGLSRLKADTKAEKMTLTKSSRMRAPSRLGLTSDAPCRAYQEELGVSCRTPRKCFINILCHYWCKIFYKPQTIYKTASYIFVIYFSDSYYVPKLYECIIEVRMY